MKKLLITVALLAAIPAFAANLGDTAADLQIATWVKGDAVKLEKGKVYVVEFWATWCPPCRKSIPHLTELQKKFKDVTFVGVTDETLEEVKPFVDKQGPEMDYVVAIDNASKTNEGYMAAYGQGGIPTAFIVNKDLQVAWVGHPMVGLDEALAKVVDGSYDVKAAEAERALVKEFEEIAQAGDAAKLHTFAQTAIDKKLSNMMILYQLTYMLFGQENPALENKELALKTAKSAFDIDKGTDPYIIALYAQALQLNGDKAGATEQFKSAIAKAEDPDLKKALEAELAKIQ